MVSVLVGMTGHGRGYWRSPQDGRENEQRAGSQDTRGSHACCGGAITALSDSDNKYEEMLLKSRIVRRTISDWVARTTAQRIQHVDMLMIVL